MFTSWARRACVVVLLLSLPVPATRAQSPGFARVDPDGFAGTFRDHVLHVLELKADGDGLTGTWTGRFAVKARPDGDTLKGTATRDGKETEFAASWRDGRLHVRCGDKEHDLWRVIPIARGLADLGEVQEDEERQWTLAIYLGGDSNLESSALADLEEMRKGLPEKGVEVIVLLDRFHDADDKPEDWSDTRILRVRPLGVGEPEVLATPGELDTSDPAVLGGFVAGVFKRYPAPHRAVFVWDHGGGWRGVVQDQDRNGHGDGSPISLKGVRQALDTASIESSILHGFDLIAFDACLMAHLEVAVEMTDLAKVMVASQANEAGNGYPYDLLLKRFASTTDAAAIARGIVEDFGAVAAENNLSSATLSAIDLAKVGDVAAAVDVLSRKCIAGGQDHWTDIQRSSFYAESYEARSARMTVGAFRSIDLLDFFLRLEHSRPDFDANEELTRLTQAIDAAVLASSVGDLRHLSHGLSIWAPYHGSQFDQAYRTTWFASGNAWYLSLIATLMKSQGASEPPKISDIRCTTVDGTKTSQVAPAQACGVQAKVEGTGIVQVQHHTLLRDGDHWIVLQKRYVLDRLWPRRLEQSAADEVDLMMPQFVDGTNDLVSEIPGMHFEASNDTTIVPCTLDMTAPSAHSAWLARAQFRFKPEDAWIDVVIPFHHSTWFAQTMEPVPPEGSQVALRELPTPLPTSEVRFAIETVDDQGVRGTTYGIVIPWTTNLELMLMPDAPQRYRADLVVDTMAGHSVSASTEYETVVDETLELWKKSWDAFNPSKLTGRWRQQILTRPQKWAATKASIEFTDSPHASEGLLEVDSLIGEDGVEGKTHQRWWFRPGAMPALRILMSEADGRMYTVYGPAAFGVEDGHLFIAMKPINVPGVAWRWVKD
ncbi:MAG: clostripain-related cysteine peptidase [Planctomycetota bacterium]